MTYHLTEQSRLTEAKLVILARELAQDIYPLEDILKQLQISLEQYEIICNAPRFQALLTEAVISWAGATNSKERIKAKAMAVLEDWMPELSRLMHDKTEGINGKIEGGKLLTKLAELGVSAGSLDSATGERFQLTINIGSAEPTRIDVTQKVSPPMIDITPDVAEP